MDATAQQSLVRIHQPRQAAALLEPTRLRILELLREPGTAAGVARKLGMARQRGAYHVKALENLGLLRHVGDRKRGNCLERVVQACARHFLIDPEMLGQMGLTPEAVSDRFSSSYLVAVANAAARDVSRAQEVAATQDKRLATLSLVSEIRFASGEARAAFAEELTAVINDIVGRYHDESAASGRRHRLLTLAFPVLDTVSTEECSDEENEASY